MQNFQVNLIQWIFCSKELQSEVIFLTNINGQLLITDDIFLKCKTFSSCLNDLPATYVLSQRHTQFPECTFFRPGILHYNPSSCRCPSPTFTLVFRRGQLVALPTGAPEGALGVLALPVYAQIPLLAFIDICTHK